MSWEPIDLGEARAAAGDASRPSAASSLVYPGKRHVFSGPPESAKTLAAYAIALEEIRLRRRRPADRLRDGAVGRPRPAARDGRHRRRARAVPLRRAGDAGDASEIVAELADRWTFTLVIVDAAAGAYALQGLDDNKRRGRRDASRGLYVRAFWLRGIATIVLDHVVEERRQAAARSRSARERKVGGADVHLGFETVAADLPRRRAASTRSPPTRTGWGTCSGRRRPSSSSAATRVTHTLSVEVQAARTGR